MKNLQAKSKKNMLYEEYYNLGCVNDFFTCEDWEDAVEGYVINENEEFIVVYNEQKIIEQIMNNELCSEEEAINSLEYTKDYLLSKNKGAEPIFMNCLNCQNTNKY